ncbi:YfaZ family outer membrane protein [Jeongeupia naejangsanensis]|uniref:YfaZ n=1 Tax=Jeongeupia naejangsanensis TaxID=613195 RepID=A0ABS2BPL0_9NEIS|nr:YfaZ family outer membrane protein [Jeongeupia naejangsanensis]MBM3117586.1 hypothetical protein [Jeongeupia naejangsanensis]
MKNILFAATLGALVISAGASASDVSMVAGEDYVAASASVNSGGLGFTADWTHNDDEGDVGGVGLGLGVPLGNALLTFGGKLVYIDVKSADTGVAGALGAGLSIPLGSRVVLYGEGYYSPDSLSSGIRSYTEAKAGVRFKITPAIGADLGYKYLNVDLKDGRPSRDLADGVYAGVNFSF